MQYGNIKKLIISALALVCILAFVSGCGKKEEEKAGSYLVVIDEVNSALVKIPFEPAKTDVTERVDEVIAALKDYENDDYTSPLPESLNFTGYTVEDKNVLIYFDNTYLNLSVTNEALVRAALVKSLCAIPDITGVSFFVDDMELSIKGRVIGTMNEDSFLDDINMAEGNTNITLCYPADDGSGLVHVTRSVEYNPYYTDEQMVAEELLKGPSSLESGCLDPFPDGTVLLNIVTKDMVCYVNLSGEFMNFREDVSDVLTVYSIVNTLCEMPGISSVMITVDGETQEFYNTLPFNDFFNYNYELMNQ